ncbi:MAG: DUF4199 domain-containing protein [Bacteroidales bacterium]|nr:DUF4199 domain-containing protein [Bacteroidales bacterium]
MTEEKKAYLQYAFRYGSIAGFIMFLYNLLGFYTKFENKLLFSDIGFAITLFFLLYVFRHYRRLYSNQNIKFGRYFAIGCLVTLCIAAFNTLYLYLKITILDPFYFTQVLNAMFEMMKEYKINNIELFTENPQLIPVMKASFLFTSFILSFVGNILYVLLLAWTMVINKKIYNNTNQNNNG